MAIHPKPFNASDRITKVKFLGRPAYFNAEDLNRQFEVHRQAIIQAQSLSGYKTTATVALSNLTYDGTTLAFRLTVGAGLLYGPIATQQVPAQILNYSATHLAASSGGKQTPPFAAYLLLNALELTRTFSDDPIMSGITSDEYPTSLPSSDHTVLAPATLSVQTSFNDPEGVVIILASVLPRPNSAGDGWDWYLFNNARNLASPEVAADATHNRRVFSTNGSVLEELELLRSTIAQTLNLSGILAQLQQNSSSIAKIWQYKEEVPIGSVMMYSGTLSGVFASTGLGIGVWAGWALMDGQGGRPDMSGKFVMGYDKTAPVIPVNVDSMDPLTSPFTFNHGALLNTGGANYVPLRLSQMPVHKHAVNAVRNNGAVTFVGGSSSAQAVNNANGATTETGPQGNGEPHENRPAYMVLAYVVKVARGAYSEQGTVGSGTGGSTGGGTGGTGGSQTQAGASAGYADGLANRAANNACPTGVTGGDCTDYQTGYAQGRVSGQNVYTANYPAGYNAGKARGIAGQPAAPFCPANVTGDACTVYTLGYNTGYAEWEPVRSEGYSAGYVAGYSRAVRGTAIPSQYAGARGDVWIAAYNQGYDAGGYDRGVDDGGPI